MSTYPLLGYQVTLPTDVTIAAAVDGVSASITVAAGTYWGWSNTDDDSGTLARAFADAIETHPEWSVTIVTSHVNPGTDGARPYWNMEVSGAGAGDDFEYLSSSSDLFDRAIGLVDGDTYETGILGYIRSKRRWLGCWAPQVLAAYAEPVYTDRGRGASSPYDPSNHDRVRVARGLGYVCEWPYVNASDISREVNAQSTGYLALAGRESGDIYGTLDDALGAAGSDSELRLVLSATEQADCVLEANGDIRRSSFTSPDSVGGRRYRVTMPLRLASAYDGVQT